MEIKAGKSYLVYLKYHQTQNIYEIIDFGRGIKEVDLLKTDEVFYQPIDLAILQFKNESNTYVSTYIEDAIKPYTNK